MFQLTTRNILTTKRNTSQTAPNLRARESPDSGRTYGAVLPRAFAQAFSCVRRKSRTHVGRGFEPLSSHWREGRKLKGAVQMPRRNEWREKVLQFGFCSFRLRTLAWLRFCPAQKSLWCFQLLTSGISPLFKQRNLEQNRAATEAPPPV